MIEKTVKTGLLSLPYIESESEKILNTPDESLRLQHAHINNMASSISTLIEPSINSSNFACSMTDQ